MLFLSIIYILYGSLKTQHKLIPSHIDYQIVQVRKPMTDGSVYYQDKYDDDAEKYGRIYAESMRRVGEYSKEGRFSKI